MNLPVRENSVWDGEAIADYLRETRNPLRLAIRAKEAPLVVPLWFLLEAGVLWCASTAASNVVRLIGASAPCGFDISDSDVPYRGVRGQGRVIAVPERGDDVLARLADRYLDEVNAEFSAWLTSRRVEETALAIHPSWLTAWDFSSRMRRQTS